MLDRAHYLSGTLSETPELDQAALRFVLDTRAELLGVVRDFRQKLATYTSVYSGDKELRRQLEACDTAIAKAEGK